jgi:hypothetical protein
VLEEFGAGFGEDVIYGKMDPSEKKANVVGKELARKQRKMSWQTQAAGNHVQQIPIGKSVSKSGSLAFVLNLTRRCIFQ